MKKIILLFLVLKAFFSFCCFNTYKGLVLSNLTFSFNKDFTQTINTDDYEMSRVAWYYRKTGHFLTDVKFGRPNLKNDTLFVSAFRPKANILLHVLGLSLYEMITQEKILQAHAIPALYYHYWGLSIEVFAFLFYALSVFYFLKILALLQLKKELQTLGVMMYLLLPSTVIYVGNFQIFETIAMPLLVIASFYIISSFYTPLSWTSLLLGALCLGVASLIRPHVLFVGAFMLIGMMMISFFISNSAKGVRLQLFSFFIILLLFQLPALLMSYHDFGKAVLSTQSNLELFQGHNPAARGSWNPGMWSHKEVEAIVEKRKEDFLLAKNEIEETSIYKEESIKWILSHPQQELLLCARKIAMFFLPYNFMDQKVNLVTFLIQFLFLVSCAYALLQVLRNRKIEDFTQFLILILPVLACLFLYLIFFSGERWRYYAEPFQILSIVVWLNKVIKR